MHPYGEGDMRKKIIIIILMISFILSIIVTILYAHYSDMKEDGLYWLFSTIAQTLGAMVGLIGMLTIYKLQTLSTQMNDFRRNYEVELKYFCGNDIIGVKTENLLKIMSENTPNPNMRSKSELDAFNRIRDRLNESKTTRILIRETFLNFLIPNITLIGLSMAVIPITDGIAKFSPVTVFIVFVFIFLLFYSLFTAAAHCNILTEDY